MWFAVVIDFVEMESLGKEVSAAQAEKKDMDSRIQELESANAG